MSLTEEAYASLGRSSWRPLAYRRMRWRGAHRKLIVSVSQQSQSRVFKTAMVLGVARRQGILG